MLTSRRSVTIATLGAGLVTALVAPAAATTQHQPTHQPTVKNRCANDHRKYVQALTATYRKGIVTISGHHAFYFCDKHEEFIKARKATKTFTLVDHAPISVLKNPEDPNSAKPIVSSRFPKYLKHHQAENYYIFKGKRTAITSLTPGFQS